MAGLLGLAVACSPNPNALGVTDTGTVTGRVVDAKTQQPIPTVVVSVGGQTRYLSPSDQGGFTIQNMQIGTQPVLIHSPGYSDYSGSVIVRKDQTSDIGLIGLAPTGNL
jgi:Carboxypeptidase regulatory-like domain